MKSAGRAYCTPPGEVLLIAVNYFCRSRTTILAGHDLVKGRLPRPRSARMA
jgi:hypothetical protein